MEKKKRIIEQFKWNKTIFNRASSSLQWRRRAISTLLQILQYFWRIDSRKKEKELLSSLDEIKQFLIISFFLASSFNEGGEQFQHFFKFYNTFGRLILRAQTKKKAISIFLQILEYFWKIDSKNPNKKKEELLSYKH